MTTTRRAATTGARSSSAAMSARGCGCYATEVRRPFHCADRGEQTVLAFTNHDIRDMRPDVAETHALIRRLAADFAEVTWRHAGAREAARAVLDRDGDPPVELTARREQVGPDLHLRVGVNHDPFGPQPFLAVRTLDKRYLTDNWDLRTSAEAWSYVFDGLMILPASIDRIGFAANDFAGRPHPSPHPRRGLEPTRRPAAVIRASLRSSRARYCRSGAAAERQGDSLIGVTRICTVLIHNLGLGCCTLVAQQLGVSSET